MLSLSREAEEGNLGSLLSAPPISSPAPIEGKFVIDTVDPVDPNDEFVSSTTDSELFTPATSPPKSPESAETPLRIKFTPLSASQNHDSVFGSLKPDPSDSDLAGKRNSRIREGAGRVLCSSIMLVRSSSEVTEMRESRSSPGSWYLIRN